VNKIEILTQNYPRYFFVHSNPFFLFYSTTVKLKKFYSYLRKQTK